MRRMLLVLPGLILFPFSSLVIIVMMLFCWIAFGGLVFSILMDLSFIDGLYFTVVSIQSIGFGDLKPTSSAARVFTIFYNRFVGPFGIVHCLVTCIIYQQHRSPQLCSRHFHHSRNDHGILRTFISTACSGGCQKTPRIQEAQGDRACQEACHRANTEGSRTSSLCSRTLSDLKDEVEP